MIIKASMIIDKREFVVNLPIDDPTSLKEFEAVLEAIKIAMLRLAKKEFIENGGT